MREAGMLVSMDETRLTIVRHGETRWNAEGRMQGHDDSPLTEAGKKQAQLLARRLGKERWDFLYSSDLGRAVQTATLINDQIGLPLEQDSGLRERALGVFQGLTWKEAEQQHAEAYGREKSEQADEAPPNGESRRQRFERCVGALEDIAQRHPGCALLVVAHGGVLDSIFRLILGISLSAPRTFSLYNCSINRFSYRNGGDWRLLTWGDVQHLQEVGASDDY